LEWNSDSSSVHHQEYFTVHTAMVYVIQVCWQLASRIRMELQFQLLKFILEGNTTCFGQFLCPSSGVFHCTHSNGICHTGLLTACEQDQDGTAVPTSQIYFGRKYYMFRTVPLSIIRSFSLYTQQWYMSYMFADSLWSGSEWNCCSILILLASCQQTFMTYTIAVCTVKNSWWWTEELSETCSISFQNKFEKLLLLVGFIIKKYITMHCHMNIKFISSICYLFWVYDACSLVEWQDVPARWRKYFSRKGRTHVADYTSVLTEKTTI